MERNFKDSRIGVSDEYLRSLFNGGLKCLIYCEWIYIE